MVNYATDRTRGRILHLLLLCILTYLVVFLKINCFHMRWWDESIYAVNTYEMLQNKSYFTPYFNGAPDMFNTKPPLINWMQMLFVKLIGYNELAIRLPSAIASCLTVLLIFIFLARNYSITWAWFSALILLTSPGFIGFHSARTGDTDALLCFFLLASAICFIKYLTRQQASLIFRVFLFLSLAFSTKMHASLLFVPGYIFLLIRNKKLKEFIGNRYFLFGISFFIITNALLLGLREMHSPGYLHELFFKETGRAFRVVETHKGPVFFYLDNLFKSKFSTWIALVIPGMLLAFNDENVKARKLLFSSTIIAFSCLSIISFSATKLEWYDLPLYPFLAIISGYMLLMLVKLFVKKISPVIAICSVVLIFVFPYSLAFRKSQSNPIHQQEKQSEACEAFIFKKNAENKNLSGIKVYTAGYQGSLIFYKYKMSQMMQPIEIVNKADFSQNDKILVSDDSLKDIMRRNYDFIVIDEFGSAQLLQIRNLVTANSGRIKP